MTDPDRTAIAWISVEQIDEGAQPTEREKQEVLEYVRRRAKPRFYADEDFPTLAIAMLRRRGANVLTTHEVDRRGHPDENHAAESLRLGRILITCDRDYLDERRFPLIHCPAIIVCGFGRGTAKDIAKTFRALFGPFTAPQFYDKWAKIDASPDGWSESVRHLDGTTSRFRYRIHSRRLEQWVDDYSGKSFPKRKTGS
jgi:hypothetical protein